MIVWVKGYKARYTGNTANVQGNNYKEVIYIQGQYKDQLHWLKDPTNSI